MGNRLSIGSNTVMLFGTEIDMLRLETGQHPLYESELGIGRTMFDQNLVG